MNSRKEKHKGLFRSKKIKFLLGAVLLTVFIGSSVNVAFADQDIIALLTSWFEKKKVESISEIDQAITEEKEAQKVRLKEELQKEIAESEKELDDFTVLEKEERVLALRSYADELIAGLSIPNEKKKEEISANLQAIVQEAIDEMNQVVNDIPNDKKENNGNAYGHEKDKDQDKANSNSTIE